MFHSFRKHIKQCLAVVFFLIALTACTTETYEAGEGTNSYLTADPVLLYTSADRVVRSAQLDDDGELLFSNPFTQDWMAKPDTVYRALLYYDKTSAPSAGSAATVKVRSVVPVPVLKPVAAADVRQMNTHPLGFESLWMSRNGKYVNLSLLLKSGKSSANDAIHSIGVVNNGVTIDADGKSTIHLELYHDQGSMPEYYTVQRYVSIDTRSLSNANVVELTINTYDGVIVKTIQNIIP